MELPLKIQEPLLWRIIQYLLEEIGLFIRICYYYYYYSGGSITAKGVDGLIIKNSILHNLGGNGIFITDYTRNVVIINNEIKKIGDTGIILFGKAYLNDGTRGEQPRNTKIIQYNYIYIFIVI